MSSRVAKSSNDSDLLHRVIVAGLFLAGIAATTLALQSVFNDWQIARILVSRPLWISLVHHWGATSGEVNAGLCDLAFGNVFSVVLMAGCSGLFVFGIGSFVVDRRQFLSTFFEGMSRSWRWWFLPGIWEVLRILSVSLDWQTLSGMLVVTLPMWFVVTLAGWCATWVQVIAERRGEREFPARSSRCGLWFIGSFCALYVVVFTWMNWQMYWGLQVPHGDSAMYEEHLWNLTHGKGFRSYLDDGRLFLGEHVQVIHIALVPLHLVWPSHLLLELCESLALASGAIAVFWLARRQTGSNWQACCLAGAYLLFMPMHYLDIAIDGKTFRPISFGVPLMLFGLDQMERRRFRTMILLWLLAILSKEDFAVIVSCLGAWITWNSWRSKPNGESTHRDFWWGLGLLIFGAVYLALVMKVVIPAFRAGDPHYFRYFGELGSSPGDVLNNFLENPSVVLGKLFSRRSLLYALFLLLPLGFLPLFSGSRLAVAAPLFGVLCLLELTGDPAQQGTQVLVPFHHFHAPLIPVLFWAASAGLGRIARLTSQSKIRIRPAFATSFVVGCALISGMFYGFTPCSIGFWDWGSDAYWRNRYVPGERAKMFAVVQELIPTEARVFSTDFVHTRFTHYRRSYDYSEFRRKSDEELTNPIEGETYYIVIDVHARYSTVKSPQDVREYREHADEWELISHPAEKYFIVLRRKTREGNNNDSNR